MRQAACPQCGTGNRFGGKDPAEAKCGRCGAKIFIGAPLDVDDAALRNHLKLTAGPILLDVWAPWCGPCLTMAPHFAEAARRLEPRVRLLKLNADQNAAARDLGVRGIPALILFEGGSEIARQSGMVNADQLVRWVDAQLRADDVSMEKTR